MTQEGRAEVAALEWVRRSVVGPAACITLVHSGDTSSVARRFGGRPERARRLTLSAAQDEFGDDPWVGVRTVGPWTLAVEVNGWQGSRPEVLDRLSSGTRVLSVYWSVNGQAQFAHAADGRVLTAFNGTTPERRTGDDPDALESMRAGLPWEDAGADPVLLMLTLAGWVTGLRVEPDWFDGEFQVVPVEPVAEAVQAAVYPDTEPLTYHDPLLAWALRHAAEEQVRDAAWTAARYAAGLAGLQTHPDVALALRDGGPAESAGLAKLAATMQRAARRSAGDTRPGGRFWAVTALREAANPLPLAAGFHAAEAAWLAASAFGKPARELRESVLAVLGHPEPPSGSLGLTARPGVLPTDRYLWTAEHWLAPVGCLTYVKGLTPAAVVEAFGGDPDDAVTGRPALTADPVAAIRDESGWAVVVEHDERAGLFTRYRRLPSQVAVSVSWSGRGRSWLHYVADGRLVAMLDPQRPEQRDGDDPGVLDEYVGDLRLGIPSVSAAVWLPTLLVLAERLTGLAFDPVRLDQPHLLARLPLNPDN